MRRGLRRKLGRSGIAVAAIGVLALVAALVLEGRSSGEQTTQFRQLVEERAGDPVDLVVAGAGNRRIIVIGDAPGASAPKRLAGAVLRRLAGGGGVDALVVGVDTSYQGALDRYIVSDPEDASILLQQSGLVDGREGRALLELFRSVYRLNEELGADRRIRILAAASEPWPPAGSLAPREAAQRFARRGTEMAERIDATLLSRSSRTRAVVLVDALQALRGGYGELSGGGAGDLEARWMAAVLAERYPIDIFSVLPDAPFEASGYTNVASYAGTRVYPLVRRAGRSGAFALPMTEPLRSVREPIRLRTGTGISLQIMPSGYSFGEVASAYVFLGDGMQAEE